MRNIGLCKSETDGQRFAEDQVGFFTLKRAAFGDQSEQMALGTRGGQSVCNAFSQLFRDVAEAVVGATGELHECELRSGIV